MLTLAIFFSLAMSSLGNDVNIKREETDDDDEDNWDCSAGSGDGHDQLTDYITDARTTSRWETALPGEKAASKGSDNFHIIAVSASIGGVLLIFLIICVVIYCVRRRNKRKLRQVQHQNGSLASTLRVDSRCEVQVARMGGVDSKQSTRKPATAPPPKETTFTPTYNLKDGKTQNLTQAVQASCDSEYEIPEITS